MKKILALVLAAAMVLALVPMTAMAALDLSANPVVINDLAEFKEFRDAVNAGNSFSGKTVQLAADIDLGNEEWTPIGNSSMKFQGHFDGQNHTVSNLKITGNNSYVGLFGFTINGSVKNLKLHNAQVSGDLGVGALAGSPYTSDYENISLTGHVEINGFSYVGGLLGRNLYADATNITVNVDSTSYVKADSVDGSDYYRTYVGGVIGFMGEGSHTVSNVTSNINVIGTVCDIGGIAGIAHYGNTFENCSSSGDVTMDPPADMPEAEIIECAAEVGGVIGVWMNSTSTVTIDNVSHSGDLILPDCVEEVYNGGLVGNAYYPNNGNPTDSTINGEEINNETEEYEAPVEPTPIPEEAPIPETGDGMGIFVFAGLAIISMLGMAVMKKREF